MFRSYDPTGTGSQGVCANQYRKHLDAPFVQPCFVHDPFTAWPTIVGLNRIARSSRTRRHGRGANKLKPRWALRFSYPWLNTCTNDWPCARFGTVKLRALLPWRLVHHFTASHQPTVLQLTWQVNGVAVDAALAAASAGAPARPALPPLRDRHTGGR